MLESRQARCHEGKIICPGNQKTQIEQFEQRLPWVPCRHGDCPLATIDHGRSEAAVGSPAPGFGSDVIGANGSSADVLSAYQSPDLRSAIAGLRV